MHLPKASDLLPCKSNSLKLFNGLADIPLESFKLILSNNVQSTGNLATFSIKSSDISVPSTIYNQNNL